MIKTWSTPVHAIANDEKVPCTLCGGSSFRSALNCDGYSFVRCTHCSLVQMNPQPTKEEISSRYGNVYGNDYLDYELKNEESFLKLQQLGLKDAGFKHSNGNGRWFLDIGCATGALLAFMRGHGWNTMGVEISPGADYAVKHRNLDVKKNPLEENNFLNEQFDIVHASHLIEHLKDPRAFLKEVNRILKHDGCVYIATPNISGFQARLFGSRWRSAIFDHLYLFSKNTLTKLLKSTGFKVIKIRTWGGLAAGAAPKWIKKIIDKSAKLFGTGDVMIIKAVKKRL